MSPAIKIFNNSILRVINADFEIEVLADDCQFTEGPVWYAAHNCYLFSDIPANVIYKVAPGLQKEIFLSNSGTGNVTHPDLKPDQAGSNALAFDATGALLICQHGDHRIGRYENNFIQSFIDQYEGRPFNSPNDLILHSSGKIYFSDPPYGLKDGKLNPEKFQQAAGVYCWNEGSIEMICNHYKYPNGVCLSADEKILYICSNKPFEKFVSTYNTDTNKFIKIIAEENSDGIECDEAGNLYLCSTEGIIVLDARGRRSALLSLPSIPSNICRGGNDLKDVFITARENVLLIRNFFK